MLETKRLGNLYLSSGLHQTIHALQTKFYAYANRIREQRRGKSIDRRADVSNTDQVHQIASAYYFFHLP